MRSNERAAALVSSKLLHGGRRTRSGAEAAACLARRLLIALAVSIAASGVAPAMEFRASRDPSGRLLIRANGAIQQGDAEKFLVVLKEAGDRTPQLVVSSGGGLVGEAVQIATAVNQARIPVVAGDMCASACFFVFAASPYPTVGVFSQLGVHRAYQRGRGETAASQDVTAELARIAQKLSVPSAVVGRIMTTPGTPRSMYWLTEDDLSAMRVKFALPANTQQTGTSVVAVASSPMTAAATMVAAGREDRLTQRRWLAGLTERGRDGAAFSLRPGRRTGAGYWPA